MSKSKVFASIAVIASFTGSAFADEKLKSGEEFKVSFSYNHTLTAEQNLAEMQTVAAAACQSVYRDTPDLYSMRRIKVKECKAELVEKAVAQFANPLLEAAYSGETATLTSAFLQ